MNTALHPQICHVGHKDFHTTVAEITISSEDQSRGYVFMLDFLDSDPMIVSEKTGKCYRIPFEDLIELAIEAGIDDDGLCSDPLPLVVYDPEKTIIDRLFIQEIINDLIRNGRMSPNGEYSKACTLLKDWSRELREKSGLKGKTKKVFREQNGKEQW